MDQNNFLDMREAGFSYVVWDKVNDMEEMIEVPKLSGRFLMR